MSMSILISMIEQSKQVIWDCGCEKCGYAWTTRTDKVPKVCPECRSWVWNESGEETVQTLITKPVGRGPDGSIRMGYAPGVKKSVAELRDLVDGVSSQAGQGPSGETTKRSEGVWQFTKDKPQYHEDGNVYRRQALAPDFKRTRTVRVDENDHDLIY